MFSCNPTQFHQWGVGLMRGRISTDAYCSAGIEAALAERGLTSHIHRRGTRNKPLTKRQEAASKVRSKVSQPSTTGGCGTSAMTSVTIAAVQKMTRKNLVITRPMPIRRFRENLELWTSRPMHPIR